MICMKLLKMSHSSVVRIIHPRRYNSSWIHRFLFGESYDKSPNSRSRVLDRGSDSESKWEKKAQKTVLEKRQEIEELLSFYDKSGFSDLNRPQVLATCERVFSHQIPDMLLSSLKTAENVKNYFTSVPNESPSQEVPLIPSIQVENLPQNLSVQCVLVKVDKRPRRRVPFANYSDPRHAHFPTKQKVTKDWKGKPVRLKK